MDASNYKSLFKERKTMVHFSMCCFVLLHIKEDKGEIIFWNFAPYFSHRNVKLKQSLGIQAHDHSKLRKILFGNFIITSIFPLISGDEAVPT